MKLIVFIFFFQLPIFLFGQIPLIKLEFQNNIDVWKPYNEMTKKYIETGGIINSKTFSMSSRILFLNRNGFIGYSGLSYQRIKYKITDYIRTEKYYSGGGSSPIFEHTYIYQDPIDFNEVSDRFGVISSVGKIINTNDNLNGILSFESEFYIFELYDDYYFSQDNFNSEYRSKGYLRKKSSVFPALNLSVNYDVLLFTNKNISYGFNVKLGGNIYSNWDQFKRYAWIGVGFNIGFGKRNIRID